MEKKWMFKIDSPWFKKGDRADSPILMGAPDSQYLLNVYFEDYPELYEQIEVKSDEEILEEWFFINICHPYQINSEGLTFFQDAARKLLSLGIVTEEGMKKIRNGEVK